MTRSWKMPLTRPSGRLACLRRTVPYGPYVCTCYAGWCAASRRGNRRLPDGRFGLPCAQRILLCDHIATILLPFLMTMQFFLATPLAFEGHWWFKERFPSWIEMAVRAPSWSSPLNDGRRRSPATFMTWRAGARATFQIGRAACRERVE